MRNSFLFSAIIAFLLLLLAIFFALSNITSKKVDGNINCYAQANFDYVFKDRTDRLELGMLFSLVNGNGIINYSGNLFSEGKKYIVKRNTEVSYSINNGTSLLIKTKNLKRLLIDDVPEALEGKYFYSNMSSDEGRVNYRIYSNMDNSYVFYTTSIPQFICKKI